MKAALYNFEPKFCPNCGIPAVHIRDRPLGRFNYFLRRTFACECGVHYENARTADLIKAAQDSEGDLDESFQDLEKDKQ